MGWRTRRLVFGAVVVGLAPAAVFGMGANIPAGSLAGADGAWPAGTREVLDQPHRVYGYWVNSVTRLDYRGAPKQLNRMIARLADLPDSTVVLVLRPGPGVALSVVGEPVGDSDWTVWTGGSDTFVVDVWLGRSIGLGDLTVPEGVRVRSGGEIESFVAKLNRSASHEEE